MNFCTHRTWSSIVLMMLFFITYPQVSRADKKDLSVALTLGNTEVAIRILKGAKFNSKKVNYKNESGNSPLHIATERGFLDIVKALLEKGARVNEINGRGATSIFLAVFHRKFLIIETLIQAEADPNIARNDGSTPLLMATQYGQLEIIQQLIGAGAQLTSMPKVGYSVLLFAFEHDMTDLTEKLLSSTIYMGDLSKDELDKLFTLAVEREEISLLRALINYGGYTYPKMNNFENKRLISIIDKHLELLVKDSSPTRELTRVGNLSTFSHIIGTVNDLKSTRARLREKAELLIEDLLPFEQNDLPIEPENESPTRQTQCFRCWDEFNDETRPTHGPADCSCSLCISCAQDLINLETTNEGASVSRCPRCRKIWNPRFLELAKKTPEEISSFKHRLIKRVLAETPSWHFCKTPDCLGGIATIKGSISKYLYCPLCNKGNCTECGETNHLLGNCEVFRKQNKLSDDFVSNRLNQKKFKKCPHCGTITEKNKGCNHMDCPRCQKRWDWNNSD
jgi:ankyrin repeat protein